jgi:hypothetical protein
MGISFSRLLIMHRGLFESLQTSESLVRTKPLIQNCSLEELEQAMDCGPNKKLPEKISLTRKKLQ